METMFVSNSLKYLLYGPSQKDCTDKTLQGKHKSKYS